jgi:hypothetical protein
MKYRKYGLINAILTTNNGEKRMQNHPVDRSRLHERYNSIDEREMTNEEHTNTMLNLSVDLYYNLCGLAYMSSPQYQEGTSKMTYLS